MQRIEAELVISVSDLKKNPSAVFDNSEGAPVAVLNHNRVMGYMVPAALFEEMIERLEDEELVRIVREREGGERVRVTLDDL